MCKKEICNAYTELNDPVVQRERFAQQANVSNVTSVVSRIKLTNKVIVIILLLLARFYSLIVITFAWLPRPN